MKRVQWVSLAAAVLGLFALVYALTYIARGEPLVVTTGIVGAALVAAILSLKES